ncbi:MAG TPA: SpoIIE family protein phosphatase, partial [Planctomycetaceae bacterium]
LVTFFVKPLHEQPPSLLFFTAVILTSWYGGMWAGLCASLLSIVALDLVFVGGKLSPQMEFVDLVDVIAFAGVAWLISFTQSRWRKAHRSLVVVEEDMYLARQIQHRMFPAQAPDLAGFDIAGRCFPADATGGDFFDYIPMADHGVGICIGDVSSHGVGPALVMSLIRAYLRALSRTRTDPGVILSETNDIACDDLEDGRFATVFLCRLEPHGRSIVYAGAGHESYLLHVSGEATTLESTGLPLGLVKERPIASAPAVTLQPGELVLLVSDGIFESVSVDRKLFGLTQTLDVVRANRHLSAAEIVAALCRAAQEFGNHAPQKDDMTVVVIKVL